MAAVSLASLSALPDAQAQIRAGDFGLGLFFGEPTGITLKGFVHQEHALVGYATWDFTDSAFATILDWQWHPAAFVSRPMLDFGMLVGAGGKVGVRTGEGRKSRGGVGVGARIPVGVWLRFKKVPIELTLEIAPGIRLAPRVDPDVDGGLGVRYFF